MNNLEFASLPSALQEQLQTNWQNWLEASAATAMNLPETWHQETQHVWLCSDFVAQICLRQPQMLQQLIDSGDLHSSYEPSQLMLSLRDALAATEDEAGLMVVLRQFRRREMLRIIWRDMARLAPLAETLRDLSALADACIDQALRKLFYIQSKTFGIPTSSDGEEQQLVVLGMGKLGGGELNVSSDVDLIFAYPEAGQTRGGSREQDNHEFFLRLGQRLIYVLNQPTADGFVFRVDMRLRPFGDSGPLVMSFDGMENYYQTHGREWERYAMIKARVVAGDLHRGEELLRMLRPFVYRRYMDYNAYESLRELKGMIEKEVARKGLDDNVKLGAGGIREVEFIAQVFQLIRGGRDQKLQDRRLFPVLDHLQQQHLLPDYVVTQLQQAYEFLRMTEHRIQGYADQQGHTLPADDVGRMRLAYAMGFADWHTFYKVLMQHRTRVHAHFEQVFAAPQTQKTDSELETQITLVWTSLIDDKTAALPILKRLGFAHAEAVYDRLHSLKHSRAYLSASARGQSRMDHLLPMLSGAALQQEQPALALSRSLDVIEAVLRRTAYLALLEENPMALSQLLQLCAASPWITHYLAMHPLLLDELLDPRSLYAPSGRDELKTSLQQRLEHLDPNDEEQLLDHLRQYKHAQVLRVAAADIAGALPLMKVSDHLTWIAEAVLQWSLDWAWRGLTAKHGCPPGTDMEGQIKRFVIIGYGKLGGLELGYGSDLDLVYLYDAADPEAMTSGERPVPLAMFYARLGQRLMHILTTLTPAGVLYEVDVRLRPDGAAGLLVSSMQAFAQYQEHKAWTWEHQALVRARAVAGDPAVAEQFERIRRQTLQRQRDPAGLLREVVDMRNKMRDALDKPPADMFDLKHSAGGIVDIEFMVQYALLAWAHQYPEVLTYTDNIRQLEALAACGVMTGADAEFLSETYRGYRGRVHRLKLQEQTAAVPLDDVSEASAAVQALWRQRMQTNAC